MIADFGLSKDLNNSSMSLSSSLFGMPVFIEPRCFNDKKYKRDKKSDIYSLGNIFWEISSGYPPFDSCSKYLIPSKIINGERELPIKGTLSAYIKLYERCWHNDPNERPDIQGVFEKLKEISLHDHDDNIDNNQETLLEMKNNNKILQTLNMDSKNNIGKLLFLRLI